MAEPSIQLQKVLCSGGLETTENHLLLSDNFPGAATRLINYEVSPSGGYKRILGYTKFTSEETDTIHNIDDANAEGPPLAMAIFTKDDGTTEYISARKLQSGDVYSFYTCDGENDWAQVTTANIATNGERVYEDGSGNTVTRIRHVSFNFGDGNIICFTDGVNKAVLYNGTDWEEITIANTGADFANAGGDQAVESPAYCTVYENHLFIGGSYVDDKALLAHSAPNASYDWTVINGAGQIYSVSNKGVGFEINGMKPFRDKLYIFGQDGIKYVSVDTSTFVIDNVTSQLGCLAPDSIVELGGDLMFLSADGFRKIGGTPKISDVDLSPLSVPIRPLINSILAGFDATQMHAIIIREKQQVRYFYGGSTNLVGLVGGLRFSPSEDVVREWGQLYNIPAAIGTSEIVNGTEQVIFGDYDGNVYFMERGNSFDGEDVYSLYSGPYLDQGDPGVRKWYRTLDWFLRSETSATVYTSVSYDWNDPFVLNPSQYINTSGAISPVYDAPSLEWDDGSTYDSATSPIVNTNIQGSAFSIRPSLVTIGTSGPHTIQGFTIEFTPHGRI